MKITIIALGSRGNVQPYLNLGQALHSAGRRVRVATFEAFAPLIHAADLEFAPLPGDAEGLLKTAGSGGIEHTHSVPKMIAALRR